VQEDNVNIHLLEFCTPNLQYSLAGYRHERSGRRAGPLIFTFSPSFSDDSQERQDKNSARQKKEKEEYEKRKRELGA